MSQGHAKKLAKVPNKAGASAIFKLFSSRPALLDKRLQPPPSQSVAPTAAVRLNQSPKRKCRVAASAASSKEQAAKNTCRDTADDDDDSVDAFSWPIQEKVETTTCAAAAVSSSGMFIFKKRNDIWIQQDVLLKRYMSVGTPNELPY
jgi:hypothetical protein